MDAREAVDPGRVSEDEDQAAGDGSADPPTRAGASALLLAGGRSRRLGADKPFVVVGGRSLLERALAATASIDDVVISIRDAAPFEAALRAWGWRRPVPAEGAEGSDRPAAGRTGAGTPPGRTGAGTPPARPGAATLVRGTRRVRLLPDPEPDPGPMAALAGGLAAARGDSVVVLSADLPFITAALVARLLGGLDAAPDADGCVPVVGGRPQWLCAAYRARLAPAALARVAGGGNDPSVRGFMEGRPLRYLDETDLAACGDPKVLTRDIDTPADLAWARARATDAVGKPRGEGE